MQEGCLCEAKKNACARSTYECMNRETVSTGESIASN